MRRGVVMMVLGLAVAVGACSPSEEADRGPEDSASTGSQEWDPQSWEPTVAIEPVEFSAAEREAHREDALARYAEQFNVVDPPQVEVVAWSQSLPENSRAMAQCLTEAGFPAESDGRAGVTFVPGVPDAQSQAVDLAYYVCSAQYPVEPRLGQDWSSDQVGLVFDYWDQYYVPCIAAQGYPVDTSDEPSREAFVAAFFTPDRLPWWPPNVTSGASLEEQRQLEQVCPALPPDSAMYGL